MTKLFAALILLLAAGCQTVPYAAYIHGDRATKNAVAPMLSITKTDHPELAESIDDLMQSWEMRISQAESTLPR